jgi:diketogulonate reductase-like aldo/keto reductase
VRKAIDRSLAECGLGHIDLYLIHGPLGGAQMRKESWRACVDAKKEGKLRSIGISTFGVGHMKELLAEPGTEVPVCTQVRDATLRKGQELSHPWFHVHL